MDNYDQTLTKKILNFIEKDRFSLTTAIIYVFIIAGVRSFMEARVGSYYGYGRYLFTQHVLLSYPQLLIGALIIYVIIRKPPKKIMNFFLLGYWILLVPPIVDYFIFGDTGINLGAQYEYLSVDEILPALIRSWNPIHVYNVGSRGQGAMFIGLMFGSASYVALKTGLHQKILMLFKDRKFDSKLTSGFIQTICTYFGIYGLLVFIGSFKAILRWDFRTGYYILFNYLKIPFYDPKYYRFFSLHHENFYISPPIDSGVMGLAQNLVINQGRLIYCSFFIILAIISTFIILYLTQKDRLIATYKNLPKTKTILFFLSALIGITSIRLIDPDLSRGFAIDPTYLMHMPYIFISLLVIGLLTCLSYFIKRTFSYDKEDKVFSNKFVDDKLNKYHYIQLSTSFALVALYFSIVIGYITFIISIIWILSCILLTVGNISIFKENLKITISGILSFFIGFYTPNAWRSYILYMGDEIEVTYEIIRRTPPLTLQIFIIIVWLAISLWFIANIILSDTKGVLPIFKKFNNEQMMILIVILLLFPLIFFNSFTAFLIFVSPAVSIPIWYKILEKPEIISFGYALQLLIFAIGFIHFL